MEAEAAVEKVVASEKTIALVMKTATEGMPVEMLVVAGVGVGAATATAIAAAMAQLVRKAGSPHATVSAA